MPDTAAWDVVAAIRDGTAAGFVEVEDPAAVAAQLADQEGVAVVAPDDLPSAVAGVRVRLAAVLVDRARRAEEALSSPSPSSSDVAAEGGADVDEDWQAVRFALLILLFALPAGLAVYAVDGMVLAAALPAAALVALGIVVLVHRRPSVSAPLLPRVEPAQAPVHPPPPVDDAPGVRAAEAHLRRQQAAWKVTWWVRDLAVPALDRWSPALGEASAPATIVVVDGDRTLDGDAGAPAPPAVRVVVLRART